MTCLEGCVVVGYAMRGRHLTRPNTLLSSLRCKYYKLVLLKQLDWSPRIELAPGPGLNDGTQWHK